MPLQSSGPISLYEIVAEYGEAAPAPNYRFLQRYYRRGPHVPLHANTVGIPSSGGIALKDFYGTQLQAPNTVVDAGADMLVGDSLPGQEIRGAIAMAGAELYQYVWSNRTLDYFRAEWTLDLFNTGNWDWIYFVRVSDQNPTLVSSSPSLSNITIEVRQSGTWYDITSSVYTRFSYPNNQMQFTFYDPSNSIIQGVGNWKLVSGRDRLRITAEIT